jgi:hypothetical protein
MPVSISGTNGVIFPDSSLQAAAASPNVLKNRIINGDMRIDQRNAGASVTPTTNATYTLDRYTAILSQASKFSVQQNAGSVTPPTGFKNYLGVTSLSAFSVASGDTFGIQQLIEGFNASDLDWGTANAKSVTLSFWVRSSLTGTFGGAIRNDAGDRSYPFTYTINSANTWELETITIAGDTSGTWLTTNGTGVAVQFGLGAGATYSGTAGAWAATSYTNATGATSVVGTNGATFYITGVMLEVGTQATTFDYRSYGTELSLCQRYYENSYTAGKAVGSSTDTDGVMAAFGYATSTTVVDYGATTCFKVPKRTAPSLAFYLSNGTANTWGFATLGNYTIVGQWVNTNGFGFYSTTVSGATANRSYSCNGHWTASAEL